MIHGLTDIIKNFPPNTERLSIRCGIVSIPAQTCKISSDDSWAIIRGPVLLTGIYPARIYLYVLTAPLLFPALFNTQDERKEK